MQLSGGWYPFKHFYVWSSFFNFLPFLSKVNNWFSNKRSKSSLRSKSDTNVSKPKRRSKRNKARKPDVCDWPIPIEGPLFVLPDDQDCEEIEPFVCNDEISQKILKVKTLKDVISVCNVILEGWLYDFHFYSKSNFVVETFLRKYLTKWFQFGR